MNFSFDLPENITGLKDEVAINEPIDNDKEMIKKNSNHLVSLALL
ncbi:MAG: hypothetical protein ACJASQ_003089 [Crocinitomicaceae bacterium]|jgi:hypothetical protein